MVVEKAFLDYANFFSLITLKRIARQYICALKTNMVKEKLSFNFRPKNKELFVRLNKTYNK